MSVFSDNLKVLRQKSGLKQAEIAKLVGITNSTWSNYEVGKSEPNIEIIVKIANALGISVDTLLTQDVSPIAKRIIDQKQENESLNAGLIASPLVGEPPETYKKEKPTVDELLVEKDKLIRILITSVEEKEGALIYLRNRIHDLEVEVEELKRQMHG